MKIERKNLPASIVELIIEEGTDKVAKYRKQAIEHIKKNANVKGFRPGALIPDEVITKNYSEEYILEITVSFALDNVYQEALKKEKIFPVAQAEIQEIISQDPLKIRLQVEVFPEIDIDTKYKKIKLKRKKIEVSTEEVNQALEDIQTRFTRFEEVSDENTKIRSGDRVTIDTDGYDSAKKKLDSTSMRDYPLVIGSNMLVPGFEEGLIGKKQGEKVELDITFPEDYHNKDFAGKKTVFEVTIKKLEVSIKPEFTPEFIKELRGKELNLEQFKELIKEEILETKEMNARLEDENALIDALEKVTKVELGAKMIKNQIKNVFEEIKQNLQNQNGVKMSDYLESLGLSEEGYKEKNVTPIAKRRLFGELVLHKLLDLEKIEVSDDEMTKEKEKILSRFENQDVLKRLEDLYKPGEKYAEELKTRMKYKKLIDSFFE